MPANDKLTELKSRKELDLFLNISPMHGIFIARGFYSSSQ
jgi:hypothetical protein